MDKSKVEQTRLSTKEALRAMGKYFELDSKKVNFWIRQMELSGKISGKDVGQTL